MRSDSSDGADARVGVAKQSSRRPTAAPMERADIGCLAFLSRIMNFSDVRVKGVFGGLNLPSLDSDYGA